MENTMEDIFDTMESALTLAGYEVLDGDDRGLIIRHSATDTDFKITVEEIA